MTIPVIHGLKCSSKSVPLEKVDQCPGAEDADKLVEAVVQNNKQQRHTRQRSYRPMGKLFAERRLSLIGNAKYTIQQFFRDFPSLQGKVQMKRFPSGIDLFPDLGLYGGKTFTFLRRDQVRHILIALQKQKSDRFG